MKADGSLSEIEIQNSILEFLKFKKIIAWRNNNGSTYDPTRGQHLRKNKWEKIHGDPVDILGIVFGGKLLAIEVKKNEKEKPSKGQQEFLDNVNNAGGIGIVAYSIRCVKTQLNL